MNILCVFGRHNYGDPGRGHGYEFMNFLPALRRMGHNVTFFDTLHRDTYADFSGLNRAFLESVVSSKPGVILCVLMHYEIWLETLEIARNKSNATIINWATDDSWKYEQFSRLIAPAFDMYATTYPKALEKSKRDGLRNVVLTQWAANADNLAEPIPAAKCRYQVSFVGSAYGNRLRWIAALKKRGVDVQCFGHGWSRGAVAAADISGIMRDSAISLNFADSGLVWKGVIPTRSRQIKARVFEVPGSGGFLMTESAEGLERFYVPGKEIIVFDGADDLTRKIEFFLAHPDERDRIAVAGYVRTRDEHTYDSRFRHLLGQAVRAHSASRLESANAPRSCELDDQEFSRLEEVHRPGFALKVLRFLLLVPCIALWGTKRGARAARRLLFEISWRVFGKKTYTASGWPGRIFYYES